MKKFKWYHYLSVGAFVAGWMSRALIDGKIVRAEIDELLQGLLDMLEIDNIEIG